MALTGIAGALPGKNGVNSGDIKNNSVKSADVKNDSLTGADINEATLNKAGLNVVQRKANLGPIASGGVGQATVNCNANEKVIGGGFAAVTGNGRLDGSRAATNPQGVTTGWIISIANPNPPGQSATFEIYALCAS